MTTHWDSFWVKENKTTFGDYYSNTYDDIVLKTWTETLHKLSGEINILDLATGNGALPELFTQVIDNKKQKLTIVGVDSARINDKSEKYYLLENIYLEDLPFQNSSFDLISSQFGIEYSDIKRSIREIYRVIKSNGRISLFIHCTNSNIFYINTEILKVLKVVSDTPLFDTLPKLVSHLDCVKEPSQLIQAQKDPIIEQLRKLVEHSLNILEVESLEGLNNSGILDYINFLFTKGLRMSLQDKVEYIKWIRKELFDSQRRLEDLIDATMDTDEINVFISDCEKLGMKVVKSDEISSDGKVYGHFLEFIAESK